MTIRPTLQNSISPSLRSTIQSISGYTGTGLLPETQAFITARGDETAAEDIDDLIRGHKELNLWRWMRVLYLWDMNDAAKNRWNVRNPLDTNAAHRASFVGTLGHATERITPAGGYVRTYFNPNIHRRQYRMAIFGYFPDNVAAGADDYYSWGGSGASGSLGIDFYSVNRLYVPSGLVRASDGSTAELITVDPMPAYNGLIGHSVKGYTHFKAYRNGVPIGSNSNVKIGYWAQQDPAADPNDIVIFGYRSYATINFPTTRPLSYWVALDGIDDVQAAEYWPLVRTYLTARGIP